MHGLEHVLVAVELALESGKPSGEHVLNVLARLNCNANQASNLSDALASELANELAQSWPLQLREEPLANVDRYDDLRGRRPTEHASDHLGEVMP